MCTAFESIMYPKLAKNENGEWRYYYDDFIAYFITFFVVENLNV